MAGTPGGAGAGPRAAPPTHSLSRATGCWGHLLSGPAAAPGPGRQRQCSRAQTGRRRAPTGPRSHGLPPRTRGCRSQCQIGLDKLVSGRRSAQDPESFTPGPRGSTPTPQGAPPRLQAGGHWLCLGHRQRRPHPRSLLQQLTGAPDYESHLTLLMATSWVPVPTPGQQETCVPSEGALRTSPTSAPIPLHGQSLRHLRPPSR